MKKLSYFIHLTNFKKKLNWH